jgi:hypothetical protein
MDTSIVENIASLVKEHQFFLVNGELYVEHFSIGEQPRIIYSIGQLVSQTQQVTSIIIRDDFLQNNNVVRLSTKEIIMHYLLGVLEKEHEIA